MPRVKTVSDRVFYSPRTPRLARLWLRDEARWASRPMQRRIAQMELRRTFFKEQFVLSLRYTFRRQAEELVPDAFIREMLGEPLDVPHYLDAPLSPQAVEEDAYDRGFDAFDRNKQQPAEYYCPFEEGDPLRKIWLDGWRDSGNLEVGPREYTPREKGQIAFRLMMGPAQTIYAPGSPEALEFEAGYKDASEGKND